MTESARSRKYVYEEPYFRETDRKERRRILEALAETEGESERIRIRRFLLEKRYDVKNGNDVDYFIRGWVEMGSIRESGLFPGMKKTGVKRAEEVLSLWQAEAVCAMGEAAETELAGELYNMARLYIELCMRDKVYGSVLWGIGHIKEEKLTARIASEFRRLSSGIPGRLGMEREFSLFREAAEQAFSDCFPESSML